MKTLLYAFAAAAIVLFCSAVSVEAVSILQVQQGGTSVGTFIPSQLIYGNGTNPLSSVATTSVTCSGSTTCTTFTAIGGFPITISSSGSGTISTSSPLVAGQGVYATGPSTIASVATSTPSVGTGLSYSGTFGNFFGGTSGTLSNTGVLSFNTRTGAVTLTSGDVTTALGFTPFGGTNPLPVANGGMGSTTLGGILAGNGTSAVKSAVIGTGLAFDGTTLSATGGSGGSVPPFATTTSTVSGEDIIYPRTPDTSTGILAIGASSTTTAPVWFDPNAGISYFQGTVGIGSTSPTAQLSITGGAWIDGTGSTLIGTPNPTTTTFNAFGGSNLLYVATTTKMAAIAVTILNDYEGTVNANVQAINAGSIWGSTVTANNNGTANGGGVRNLYTTINASIGHNVAMQSSVAAITDVQGTLASTTSGTDFVALAPLVDTGNLMTNFRGLWVRGGTVSGTVTNGMGVDVNTQTLATNNSDILFGTETAPTGNYGLYQGDAYQNYLQGNTGIGSTSPSQKLSVQGNALLSGNLSVANLTATGTATFSGLGTGLVKSTAGVLGNAVSGTDFAPATSGSSILSGNGSGGFTNITVSSPLSFSASTLSLGTVPLNLGGTATTTFWNGGLVFSDGSKLTQSGGGASALFWDNTNSRLGIGTTSPYGGLSLNAPAGTAPYFVIGSSSEVMKITQSANPLFGIGTSSPMSAFAVSVTSAIAQSIVQFIGGTAYVTEQIDALGHLRTGGPPPTVGTCTGFSVVGDDRSGTVTMTSGTSCSINFANAYSIAPACSITPNTANSTYHAAITTTGITVGFGTGQTSWSYVCQYHQ